jgi:hypothetical protein
MIGSGPERPASPTALGRQPASSWLRQAYGCAQSRAWPPNSIWISAPVSMPTRSSSSGTTVLIGSTNRDRLGYATSLAQEVDRAGTGTR